MPKTKRSGPTRATPTPFLKPGNSPRYHPNNRYRAHPPDFTQLAVNFPEFAACCHTNGSTFWPNFQDPQTSQALTVALARQDFDLDLRFPPDTLCPTLPNRLDYLHVIEDLVVSSRPSGESLLVHGIDIGTGASCIYPLLGCRLHPHWQWWATEIHRPSISCAVENVKRNRLANRIRVVDNSDQPHTVLPTTLLADGSAPPQGFDFCMCNPPFYESQEEIHRLQQQKSRPPHAVNQAQFNELVVGGGEAGFISRMIVESCRWRTRIRWYSSLVGKASSLPAVVRVLRDNGIVNFGITELQQGYTRRWVVVWTFQPQRLLPLNRDTLPLGLADWLTSQGVALLRVPSAKGLTKLLPKSLVYMDQWCFSSQGDIKTWLDDIVAPERRSSNLMSSETIVENANPSSSTFLSYILHIHHDFWSRRARRGQTHPLAGTKDPALRVGLVFYPTVVVKGNSTDQAFTDSCRNANHSSSPPHSICANADQYYNVYVILLAGFQAELFQSFYNHLKTRASQR
ncbi:hypothetical protein IWQ62_003269 [Dispira parvispora]|uniref:U6 small nuclear RNA (adenine-(43)-N(6))-methyltransferase n=1 Tax=Dispira parvispora TaxID=1520584 RepID=A0A9W8AS51_9FUNG|nr:hypothetical protein IWQ62_003269 [Dispira parvispora]